MKIKFASLLLLITLIIACDKEDPELQEFLALKKNNRIFQAHYTKKEKFKLRYTSNFPKFRIDPTLANGLKPTIYMGDTIGYQCYKNGLKHGPYFTMLNKRSIMDGNVVPDGVYENGRKNGFFYRYRAINDIHYIAYYENDQLLWADHYYMMEIYPSYPFILKKDDLYIEAKHPNGNMWFKGEYRKGRPYGVHKYYYADGMKRGEINYAKNKVTEYYYYEGEKRSNSYDFDQDDIYSENF